MFNWRYYRSFYRLSRVHWIRQVMDASGRLPSSAVFGGKELYLL